MNEERIGDHLGKLVRSTVEETLNGLLDVEADRICNAEKYQSGHTRRETLCLSRWDRSEAVLGRGDQQRIGTGGDRGEWERA